MPGLHVVFGTGPAGTWTAKALVDAGHRVRAVNRSGVHPEFMPADVEVVRVADASDPAQATRAAAGAEVVYQCLNPPYHQWHDLFPGLQRGAMAAAKAAGARYVSLENLYMYGHVGGPISETSVVAPVARKGMLRAQMADEVAQAHARGELECAQARASDYYGPGVTASALGDRTFEPLIAGKKAELAGSADVPHSYAYIEDVGRGIAALGTRDDAFGQVWILPHAPARTGRQTLAPAFETVGLPERITVVGATTLRVAGLFMPGAREMVEMMYEFTEPFVVDSSKFEQTFGFGATSFDEGVPLTVTWFQQQARARRSS